MDMIDDSKSLATLLISEITGPLTIYSDSQSYYIRQMRFTDLNRISAMEKEIFSSPWSRRTFEGELSNNTWSISLVVEHKGEVIGYSVSWIVADELHIANIAVAPKHRRLGVSKELLYNLMSVIAKKHIRIVHLEVRQTNYAAIALYQKLGFEIVGIRRGYYQDTDEDAMLMSRDLTDFVKTNDNK